MIGRVFQQLTVIERSGKSGPRRLWLCRCSCGGAREATTTALTSGMTRSCGCAGDIRADLTGKRFGRLTVVSQGVLRGPRRTWVCACACGGRRITTTTALVRGSCQSCGCLNLDWMRSPRRITLAVEGTTTHGKSRTRTHRSWCDMIQRCTNPKRNHYEAYGGAGIVVCERWRGSFAAFLSDMGERPEGTSIDRFPDRDGNYEPGNCRWATPVEQAHNKDSTVLSIDLINEIRGRAEHGESQKSIAERMGVTDGHINNIIARRAWGHVP